MFERYFFDKRQMTDFQVFQVLKALESTNFTINRLSQETGLSYAQSYNSFQEVMTDLQQLTGKAIATINEVAFKTLAKHVSVDQYRYFQLKSCISYQFFDYLWQTPAPNVHDFCQARGLSISTLRRHTDGYRNYLQAHNVTLQATSWQPQGAEITVRMAMLTFYELAFRGSGWPFGPTNYQKTLTLAQAVRKRQVPKDQHRIPTKQQLMALAVQVKRVLQGDILPPTQRLAGLFETSSSQQLPTVFTASDLPNCSSMQLAGESLYYYFMQLHPASIQSQLQPLDRWLLSQFGASSHPVARFAQGLLQWICSQCPEKPQQAADHQVLLANLYRVAASYYLMEGSFSRRLDFSRQGKLMASQGYLADLIHTYFKTLPEDQPQAAFKGFYQAMHRTLYAVIRPDFPELTRDLRLNVTVIVEPGTFGSRDLAVFLQEISFVHLVPARKTPLPDVVITTIASSDILTYYYHERLQPKQLLQWQIEAADNSYFGLYRELKHAYQTKLAPK